MDDNQSMNVGGESNPGVGAGGSGEEAKSTPALKSLRMTVVGVGGAGRNAVEALAGRGLEGVGFVVLNTDAMGLGGELSATRFQLGAQMTRGLGAGGDPEVGRAAAEADVTKLRELCQGSDLVFIMAGMGGGTGTGGAPVVARVAKEAGALVLGVVTTPFGCEGTRRQRQAAWGVEQLKAVADAVICLPNEKVLKLVDDRSGVMEVFRITNDILAEGVCSICRMLSRPGVMHVDFADFCSVLRGRHAESLLATARARGENRVAEIVDRLIMSPFVNGGQGLGEADALLVSFVGGADFSMGELNRVMDSIHKHCGSAHVFIGATIDPTMTDGLAVTLIASKGGRLGVVTESAPANRVEAGLKIDAGLDFGLDKQNGPMKSTTRFLPPEGGDIASGTGGSTKEAGAGGKLRQAVRRMRQGMLPLEVVSRGRFEKSEPTLHKGEDLDIPTYIRRGVPLN